jgi:putative phage-type endonuclease
MININISTDIGTLIDVTEQIIPEEQLKYFNDDESLELYQTCICLMEELIEEYPFIITEPDFDDFFDENIQELMVSQFDFDVFYTDDAEEELEEIIEETKNDFFKHFIPPRSYPNTMILGEPDSCFIDEQMNVLRNKPQPSQRTKEWYEFRHNLITASNAYKAFENQNVKNQLIYEKCQPLNQNLYINNDNDETIQQNTKEIVMVNVNTTLHWGQKYEPLSVNIYEHIYKTKIEDFGCIQHEKYLFLGASPDGINVDKKSKRYGRMLEIKNIVNREIDGIPKKEYWIQMQLQMEVCDLDECDFLETKFTEYSDYNSYLSDTSDEIYEDEEGFEFKNMCLSKDEQMKGIIIYFHTKEGKPFYVYKPLELIHPKKIEEWQENIIDYYQTNSEYNYVFMKTIYWKLDTLSCVLVCRNRQWFKDNIYLLQEIWNTIEKERISGYEHRAPNRKSKKELIEPIKTPSSGCLLRFHKETGKINVIKKEADNISNLVSELKNIDINFDVI